MRLITIVFFTILSMTGLQAQSLDSTSLEIRIKLPIGEASFDYIEIHYKLNQQMLIRESKEYVFRSEGATKKDTLTLSDQDLLRVKQFLQDHFPQDTYFPVCRAMSIVYTSIEGYANGRRIHITYAPCRDTRLTAPFDKLYTLMEGLARR